MGKSLRYILLLLPLCALASSWPNAFFLDEFEQGNCDIWSTTNVGTGCSITMSSNVVNSGNFAARFTTPAAVALVTLTKTSIGTNYASTYVSLRLNIESFTGLDNNEFVGFLRCLDQASGTPDRLYVKKSSGNLILRSDLLGDCTTVLSTGQWYHIEVEHAAGSGTGTSTIYINGTSEKTGSSLTANAIVSISVGVPYNGFGVGTQWVLDDVRFGLERVYEPNPFIRYYAPDFRARVGNRVKVIVGGANAGDILSCWLSGPDGYSNSWFNAATDGAELVKGTYTNAATGDYTFTMLLSDSNSTPRVTNIITWTKDYSGDPTYSIDQENNILKSGQRLFVVDAMCLNTNALVGYISSNLINTVYGQPFTATPSTYLYYAKEYLDICSNQNMYAFIPVTGAGFTPGNGTNPFTTNIVAAYCTNTDVSTHQNLVGFDWFDEAGDENNYTPAQIKEWFDLSKTLLPSKLNHINHMGDTHKGPQLATSFNNERGHSLVMPWQLADIYSADLYPYEYTNSNQLSYFPWVAKNLRYWNHDTIPFMMYVGVGDVRSGNGGAPTTNQLWSMCWTAISAGAKGIHWYPYQLGIPPANFTCMSNFVSTVTRLNNVLCADEAATQVTWNNTNIWNRHVTLTGTNYYIASNASETSQTVTFTHSDIKWGRWIRWDNSTDHVTSTDGAFTDTLTGYGVKIYYLDNDVTESRSRATVTWQ